MKERISKDHSILSHISKMVLSNDYYNLSDAVSDAGDKLKGYAIVNMFLNVSLMYFSYWTEYVGVFVFYWDHLHRVHHSGKNEFPPSSQHGHY